MIKNLFEYFLPEQEFYLYKISYEKLDSVTSEEMVTLNSADNVSVEMSNNNNVKIIVTRSLYFDPEEMFRLSVAFGANLKFDPQKTGEYDWDEINLAEEFRDNGDFVTDHLMSRITLLIAQITSSSGQQPLILPPKVAQPTANE
ncbi:MAG: hypothetical protein NC079_02540 [Clostridium sp.]|nr:hypothetical protein [Acetatifactor muris]MCM1527208.1 hypothetical protein [Bacteroides sp.]MCM1562467.1 hypothetical protein [Clostridium sp.]